MSLRRRVLLYGFVLILVTGTLLLVHLLDDPLWFGIGEIALVVLAVYGYRLMGELFGPLELLSETTRLLSEQDFTTRLRPVGHPEMDRLIDIYNRMTEILRQERIHNREQRYFLSKVLETTSSAIITFDFDGRIKEVNPAAEVFLERKSAELAGKTLTDVGTTLSGALDELEVGVSRVIAFRGRRRLMCRRAHFLDRGFYRNYIFIDELTAELRRTEKEAYEKLIRVMSHEINNSLGAANSLLHSCLYYSSQISDADRDDYRNALQVIISRTEHLKAFVGESVSLIKLPEPSLEPSDLFALLEHAHRLPFVELERRRIRWQWDCHEVPPIAVDRAQMEQVFLNIIKNAMEAIGEDGLISARIRATETGVLIIVEDSGPGIEVEIEANLFTPFYTTKASGHGIGLTLVADVLNNHGFDFALESQPGEPTRFKIWL